MFSRARQTFLEQRWFFSRKKNPLALKKSRFHLFMHFDAPEGNSSFSGKRKIQIVIIAIDRKFFKSRLVNDLNWQAPRYNLLSSKIPAVIVHFRRPWNCRASYNSSFPIWNRPPLDGRQWARVRAYLRSSSIGWSCVHKTSCVRMNTERVRTTNAIARRLSLQIQRILSKLHSLLRTTEIVELRCFRYIPHYSEHRILIKISLSLSFSFARR